MGGERGLDHGEGAPPRGRRTPGAEATKRELLNSPDEALGRGSSGFSTKVRLSCDGGRPPSVLVTAGQRNEAPLFGSCSIRAARSHGTPGRPRKRPVACTPTATTPTTYAGAC